MDLAGALRREEFELHYQPTIDLRSGMVTGAEALVRWQHPERGQLSPIDFIPAAEDLGLIHDLDLWVLRAAAGFARQLHDGGLVRDDFRMAVNVSPLQLEESTLLDDLARTLPDAGLAAGSVMLELTESSLLDVAQAIPVLEGLRDCGFTVAIDDFGTGYSALAHLHQLPADVVKIDRSFVEGVDMDIRRQATARAILVLAQCLELRTVAEGVERPAQVEALRGLDCDEAQGYHFARPAPAAEFIALIERFHGA